MKTFKKSNINGSVKQFNVSMLDASGNPIGTVHSIYANNKNEATTQAKSIMKYTRGAVRHSKVK